MIHQIVCVWVSPLLLLPLLTSGLTKLHLSKHTGDVLLIISWCKPLKRELFDGVPTITSILVRCTESLIQMGNLILVQFII